MMKITQSDIASLIDVTNELKACYTAELVECRKPIIEDMIKRVRKIYILLLNVSEGGQLTLDQLRQIEVPDNSIVAHAVESLNSRPLKEP